MDSVSIIAIIAGCSALLVAILTHIKHSTCRNGTFSITTVESNTPTIQTPEQTFHNIIESVSRPPSPVYKTSEPIPIPKSPSQERKHIL